ncbi:MAG: VanZ family protein [Bacteroidales bacterium]|nr:VanZ family protein [Bacteroidales bacterium]
MTRGVITTVNKYKLSMFAIALLLYLSFANTDSFDDVKVLMFPYADKVIHFLMYFGVALALYIDFIWLKRKGATILSMAITSLLAAMTELGQLYLTDTRSGDIFDFLCNIAGGVMAMIVAPYTANLYFKFINYVRKLF